MAERMIPDGVYDFGELVSRDDDGEFLYYFVDKTLLIREVCRVRGMTFLFTRPRRFGKSINNSMIDRYFNISYKDGPNIFDGLKIDACEECKSFKNRFPVVKLDFEMISGTTEDELMESIRCMVSSSALKFQYLLNESASDGAPAICEVDKKILLRTIEGPMSKSEILAFVKGLCRILHPDTGRSPSCWWTSTIIAFRNCRTALCTK